MRDLHRGHEREDRDKQKAKIEVDRLNGVVSGPKPVGRPGERSFAIPASKASSQATPAERKKQLQQLAEMGVVVPEDFRREMAMVGDWQTTSQRILYDSHAKADGIKKEEDGEDSKATLNIGVRKRKFEGQEEEEDAGERVVRKGWGSTTRAYPGAGGDDEDLDALLQTAKAWRSAGEDLDGTDSITGDGMATGSTGQATSAIAQSPPTIKHEDSMEAPAATIAHLPAIGEAALVKQEEDDPLSGVVFKKRKPKAVRSK